MDADELYGLPLDRFTPERNALAKELRNAGKRAEAAEVAALRKPSVAAWAVNQLVRTQRRGVGELFEAGDALRSAHDQVLAGRGDGSSLRTAVERERAAVDGLTAAAGGLLTSDGHELSAAIIDRVADTLHAAALDDDARAQVRDGRLVRELRHVGLGMGTMPASPPAPRKPAAGRSRAGRTAGGRTGAGPTAAERAAAERAERAERERAEARAAARVAARVAEREARRRLERAERAAHAAAERRDRAAAALSQAEAELADAQSERDEADAELRSAERALRD